MGKINSPLFRSENAKSNVGEIGWQFADHNGFTAKEQHYIINYDIKCRIGW